MGSKANPKIMRIGTIYGWDSKWFNRKNYKETLRQDVELRVFLKKELREAALDRVIIERGANQVTLTIHSGKPGFVIGRAGSGIEVLKKKIKDTFFRNSRTNINVNVIEVTRPTLSANIVMQGMIADLERRMPFRRILKQTVDRVQKAGALGVKVQVAGRLNGAEIARTEALTWGSVPLQNLRADIDYASDFARTIFGAIGVKVWIYRGEVFEGDTESKAYAAAPKGREGRDNRGPSRGRRNEKR